MRVQVSVKRINRTKTFQNQSKLHGKNDKTTKQAKNTYILLVKHFFQCFSLMKGQTMVCKFWK